MSYFTKDYVTKESIAKKLCELGIEIQEAEWLSRTIKDEQENNAYADLIKKHLFKILKDPHMSPLYNFNKKILDK